MIPVFSSITGRHTLRFVTALAVLAVVVLAVFRDGIVGPAMVPLQALAAEATLFCLRALGIGAVREVSVVYLPGGFGYEISRGCVGLVPALFLGVAISAYPAIPQRKLLGLAVGIPALLTINLARLVHLFYLGTYRPDIFHLAHEVIWQGVIIFVVFGIWLGWAIWADSGGRRRERG